MGERENLAIPYTLGFAALSITAVAVFGLSNPRTLVPSQNYELKHGIAISKPWEQHTGTNPSISEVDREVLLQINAIKNFADSLLDEIVDLDPSIVKVVNDNFWNLLA